MESKEVKTEKKSLPSMGTWNVVLGSNRQFSNRRQVNAGDRKIFVIEDYTGNEQEAEANAEYIVNCVNTQDQLISALQDLTKYVNSLLNAPVKSDYLFNDLEFYNKVAEAKLKRVKS